MVFIEAQKMLETSANGAEIRDGSVLVLPATPTPSKPSSRTVRTGKKKKWVVIFVCNFVCTMEALWIHTHLAGISWILFFWYPCTERAINVVLVVQHLQQTWRAKTSRCKPYSQMSDLGPQTHLHLFLTDVCNPPCDKTVHSTEPCYRYAIFFEQCCEECGVVWMRHGS